MEEATIADVSQKSISLYLQTTSVDSKSNWFFLPWLCWDRHACWYNLRWIYFHPVWLAGVFGCEPEGFGFDVSQKDCDTIPLAWKLGIDRRKEIMGDPMNCNDLLIQKCLVKLCCKMVNRSIRQCKWSKITDQTLQEPKTQHQGPSLYQPIWISYPGSSPNSGRTLYVPSLFYPSNDSLQHPNQHVCVLNFNCIVVF